MTRERSIDERGGGTGDERGVWTRGTGVEATRRHSDETTRRYGDETTRRQHGDETTRRQHGSDNTAATITKERVTNEGKSDEDGVAAVEKREREREQSM